jgi:putative oxidoreductase
MTYLLTVIAHLLMGGAFVVFGMRNINAVTGLSKALAGRKVPMPRTAAQIGVGLQLVGGVLVFIAPFVPFAGVFGGLALIVFLVLATLLFHPAWEYQGEARKPHVNALIMNTCLAGAFLLVLAYGV